VRSPHVEAAITCRSARHQCRVINALAHVIVTEGLVDEAFVRERCDPVLRALGALHRRPENSAGSGRGDHRRARTADPRRGAALCHRRQRRDLLRPRRHRAQPGLDHGHGMANLAMATGNIGRDGVGVNPLRGQNNVQGSCDMGSFPHDFSGYRHVSDDATREMFEPPGASRSTRAGPAHPQHARRGRRGHLQGHLRPGRGHRPVRPQHAARDGGAAAWNASWCRTCS
jgi:formate dehydrogenase major subunit